MDPVDLYCQGATIPQSAFKQLATPTLLCDQSISSPVPEGGYQDPEAWSKAIERLLPTREPPRSMEPGEFVEILRRHCHPRWPSIGVVRTRFGDLPRQEAGYESHGTIYVANATERRWICAISAVNIPYGTIRTAVWDEQKARFVGGRIVRGWRRALHDLVAASYLLPDDELSYLIGTDTFKLFPAKYRR